MPKFCFCGQSTCPICSPRKKGTPTLKPLQLEDRLLRQIGREGSCPTCHRPLCPECGKCRCSRWRKKHD